MALTDPTTPTLERFRDQTTVVLTSYRRDGTPVDTPVHIAVEGDRAYIRTYATAFKARRLRRNPEVVVWTATGGTRPALTTLMNPKGVRRTGSGVRARARLLTGDESQRAARVMARQYPVLHGFLIPWMHRHWYRTQTIEVELTPVGEPPLELARAS